MTSILYQGLKWILLHSGVNWILQTGYSTTLLFFKNELPSHASAAAYYFLLAIAPLTLAVISIANMSLNGNPELVALLFATLTQFNEQLNEDFFRGMGVIQPRTAVSGLSLLGFLWISRLIVGAIQSAFGVIFPSTRCRGFFWSNLLSMVLVPGVLTLLMLSSMINFLLRFLHEQIQDYDWLERIYNPLLSLSGAILPTILVFGLIFICYRFLPLTRPSTRHAALGAALCTVTIFALKSTFINFVKITSYHIIYGSLSAVILLLLWVYTVFLVFFLFAQFVYVAGRIDIIVLERIIAPRQVQNGFGQRLERSLFGPSCRVFMKYARCFAVGEQLFAQGQSSNEVYYLHQGRVAIFAQGATQSVPVAVIEEGQIFGEMAYLLGTPRTAAARVCDGPAQLLVIPPHVFESLLEHSPAVSRKIIAMLSQRLRHATLRHAVPLDAPLDE